MIFLVQIRILKNFFLLHHYLFLYWSGTRTSSRGFIFSHLHIVNCLFFLEDSQETTAGFGLKHFLLYSECKPIFYVHRVRPEVYLFIPSVCHLSVFQVITISPRNSKWAEFNVKAPKYIGPSSVLSWILHKLLSTRILMHVPSL